MRSMAEVPKRDGNVTNAPVNRTILHQRCEIVKPQIYLRNGVLGICPNKHLEVFATGAKTSKISIEAP